MRQYVIAIMVITFALTARGAYCQAEYADREQENIELREILALEQQEDQRIMQEDQVIGQENNRIAESENESGEGRLIDEKEGDRAARMEESGVWAWY